MSFRLPVAPPKYNRTNENDSRRQTDAALTDILARLEAIEAVAATPPEPVGPIAGFTHTADFLVVTFTDDSIVGTADIVARLWTYGDGTTSSTTNNLSPIHTYPTGGTYQATLRCTDSNGLQNTTLAQAVSVSKQPAAGGRVHVLLRGVDSLAILQTFDWFNAGQAANMTPDNCVATLDGFANAGIKCFVRLWRPNFALDGSGMFSMTNIKNEIKRYADAGLTNYLNSRAQDGTIIFGSTMDDIMSIPRWGRLVTKAEVEEIAAYHRSLYFAIPAWARARATQLTGFDYNSLQGIDSIYLFGRGGVSQGGQTAAQWRLADVTAYRDQELAALATIATASGYSMDMTTGINIENGGDGSSGIPADTSNSGNQLWRMSADELQTYGDILIPVADKAFTYWQWADEPGIQAWLAMPTIEAKLRAHRVLADAQ